MITVPIAYQHFGESFFFGVFYEEIFAFDARKAIESAGQCQVFNVFTVACRKVDALHKVEDVFEQSVLFTFGKDALYRGFAYSLDGSQAEADVAMLVYRNFMLLSFTSGPNTLIPVILHSSISLVISVMFEMFRLMVAAMYSEG